MSKYVYEQYNRRLRIVQIHSDLFLQPVYMVEIIKASPGRYAHADKKGFLHWGAPDEQGIADDPFPTPEEAKQWAIDRLMLKEDQQPDPKEKLIDDRDLENIILGDLV